MLSKNPKLSMERLLIFGAVGLYLYKYLSLQKKGELAGEPDLLVKVDKQKMFDMAQKKLRLNPMQRMAMEGIYSSLFEKGENESST